MANIWDGKTIEKIFKYFGYDVNNTYTEDEKAKIRATAVERILNYPNIPDEIKQKASSYNDEQIKREEKEKERRLEMARIRREKEARKLYNRENDEFSDDEYAQALYQHFIDEQIIDSDEVEELTSKKTNLEEKLKKLTTKLERLKESGNVNNPKIEDKISELESEIDEVEDSLEDFESELNDIDIYGVILDLPYTHYGLRTFETEEGDYAVGTEDESEDAAKQSVKDTIEDVGIEAFSSWVIESNIDKDRLKNDLIESYVEYYEDRIRYDLSDYFEDYDEDDEDTHPDDDDIEEKAKELAEDRAEELLSDHSELEALGIDIKDYVDIDGVINDVISADGTGHTLSSYDGTEYNVNINGTWYNIYRTN